MAVEPAWHRRGTGAAMLAETERLVRADWARLLTVKTLGPSRPSKECDDAAEQALVAAVADGNDAN